MENSLSTCFPTRGRRCAGSNSANPNESNDTEAPGRMNAGSLQRVFINVPGGGLLSWFGGKGLEHFCNVLIKLLGVSRVIGGEIFGRETAPQDLL